MGTWKRLLFRLGLLDFDPDLSAEAVLIEFSSAFLPHGRGIRVTLRSEDGKTGTLTIKSRPRWDAEPDVDCIIALPADEFAAHEKKLALEDVESYIAPVQDGWRTHVKGYRRGKGFARQYVFGAAERDVVRQASTLMEIIESVLETGRRRNNEK